MKLKKRYLGFLVLFAICMILPLQADAKVNAPKKECHAYAVLDAGSGELLFGQDADKVIYPASTAKIMTAIVCIENGDVNSTIKTDYDTVYGTTLGTYCLGIGAGVKYKFKDLLAMSLISSAADATDSLAVGVFGSKKACVEAMNKKCEELGLTQTHFDNPVGSDIGAGFKETYATAREMAIITRYAMSMPLIRDMVKKRSYSPSARDITANTTNWFLRGMAWYDDDKYKIIGTKSGTTNAAGHVFIATAMDKEGHEVICAYFGNVSKESTFASIRSLYDFTFKQYKKGNLTLTPSNYDIRCTPNLGKAYSKYAYLDCFPGESDGKFYKNRPVTKKQLSKMVRAVNGMQDNMIITKYVRDNVTAKVTAAGLADLVQRLYPSHLNKEKVDEILADCKHTETLTDQEKEAFAIFVKAGLTPDNYCKNASQVITRKEAVYFVDKLHEYQKVYQMIHYSPLTMTPQEDILFTLSEEEAEEAQTGAEDSKQVAVKMPGAGIYLVDQDWAKKMEAFHAEKEAERAQRAAEKAAKEVAAENTTTAEEATTESK